MDLAMEKEIKKAKKLVLKKEWQLYYWLEQIAKIWCHKKSEATKYDNGNKQWSQISQQNNEYPQHFHQDKQNSMLKKTYYNAEGTEVAFTQARDLSKVTCYNCEKKVILQWPVLRRILKKHKFILKCAKPRSKQVMTKMN